MMLICNLRAGKMEILIDHLEGSVPENLLQAEYITPVKKIVRGESMTAKMYV